MEDFRMEHRIRSLEEFVLKSRANQIFQECQIRNLENHLLALLKKAKAVPPDGLTIEQALQKSMSNLVHKKLASMADEDQELASVFFRILTTGKLEPPPAKESSD